MWETGVRIPVWVMLCYTNKSPWARLLTLYWPTCNVINLVSRSGYERQLNTVNVKTIWEHETPCDLMRCRQYGRSQDLKFHITLLLLKPPAPQLGQIHHRTPLIPQTKCRTTDSFHQPDGGFSPPVTGELGSRGLNFVVKLRYLFITSSLLS